MSGARLLEIINYHSHYDRLQLQRLRIDLVLKDERGRIPAIGSHRNPTYDLICTPSNLFQLDHHGKLI